VLFLGSRYSGIPLVSPENISGQHPRVLAARAIPETPAVAEHTVVEGERLDHLAQRFYSDAQKYWIILDANPGVLNPFHLLQVGGRIGVPRNRIVSP
jgi:nucleoid-associated protein YgaU